MKRIAFLTTVSLCLVAMIGLQSCQEAGCLDPRAINYNPDAVNSSDDCEHAVLALQLTPKINGEDFTLGEVYSINGVNVRIDLFQFYVTEIGIGMMDELEMLSTPLLVKADIQDYPVLQVSAGHKHMLAFNVGVDSATNHLDPTTYLPSSPLAPQNPVMHWNWDAGYQFIKIEGQVDTDGDGTVDDLLEMHIGKDSNLARFMAEADKEADVANFTISLTYDIEKFFTDVDLRVDRVTHTADGPVLAAKVAANAPTAFTIQ